MGFQLLMWGSGPLDSVLIQFFFRVPSPHARTFTTLLPPSLKHHSQFDCPAAAGWRLAQASFPLLGALGQPSQCMGTLPSGTQDDGTLLHPCWWVWASDIDDDEYFYIFVMEMISVVAISGISIFYDFWVALAAVFWFLALAGN